MTRIALVTVLAMIPFAAPAAEGPPRYSPAAHCESVAATADGSRVIYNGCMEMEQDAYDELKVTWPGIPARARRRCDEVARSGGKGTYVILKGCLDMETDAAASAPEFKF